jgi:hypothetical protein
MIMQRKQAKPQLGDLAERDVAHEVQVPVHQTARRAPRDGGHNALPNVAQTHWVKVQCIGA